MAKPAQGAENTFFTDVQTLRARAKEHLDQGPVTKNYGGDVKKSIELLQTVVATEIVCVLRYTMNSISVSGITSESVGAEFAEHAEDERRHMKMASERIDQLGGTPNLDPEGLATRSATEYGNGGNLVQMVTDNLVAERLVIEHYRELIRYFGENDPTTRVMLEKILADEEDHATDMHDLLVAHEGKPMLSGD
ncbi:MAG: ferritin-like domain-containing protein [Pseudomonadota bacterium]|nr:ferritin-like domain-containing protein [Pseudomonadota bacterium]